jgi:hypothetical protein
MTPHQTMQNTNLPLKIFQHAFFFFFNPLKTNFKTTLTLSPTRLSLLLSFAPLGIFLIFFFFFIFIFFKLLTNSIITVAWRKLWMVMIREFHAGGS